MKFKSNSKLISLIENLSPELNSGEYVYCSVDKSYSLSSLNVICVFIEKEGKTIVLDRSAAESRNLEFNGIMSWITLNVYSSLEAVGLTAIVSEALANKGISCNMIAAFNHDHIFVSKQNAEQAMDILKNLSL